jgi:cell division septation protein DedD
MGSEKGDPRAMLVYGTALFNGDGVAQDPVLGYAYVSRSAAQGLEPARNTLAQMDEIIPLAQRRKGVALALQKAKTQSVAKSAPKPTQKVAQTTAPRPKAQPVTAIPTNGAWRIQLGAFSQRSSAEALFRKLSGSAPVAGHQQFLIAAGTVTRLQVGPYSSKAAALAACGALSGRGQPCFPVAAK